MQDKSVLTGTVTLTNTKNYPFNNSLATVALPFSVDSRFYEVLTTVEASDGETGDIIVFGKAVNGFKLAYTGSAHQVVVGYRVLGGNCHDCN